MGKFAPRQLKRSSPALGNPSSGAGTLDLRWSSPCHGFAEGLLPLCMVGSTRHLLELQPSSSCNVALGWQWSLRGEGSNWSLPLGCVQNTLNVMARI